MSELEKAYNPKAVEDGIYEKWEKSGYFNPDNLQLVITTTDNEIRTFHKVEEGSEKAKTLMKEVEKIKSKE